MDEPADRCHVRLHRLSRSFREGEKLHRVLQGIEAEIPKGQAVALRGRSGSGKSTLLNVISGIDRPDEGEVVIGGVTITSLSERDRTLFRRRHIGFVYQAFNLIPTLSVADNIRLVLELNGVSKKETAERVRKMLHTVQLADRAGSFPDVLSGGEQQRVSIARALAHRPALLLADEPTGNLDDATAEVVLTLLLRLVRDAGGTLLIATHSASIAAICDRSIELRDGRLIGTGADD
jgi:putative ABC transport system ATP-binding protein